MTFWRIHFGPHGGVERAERLSEPGSDCRWVIVEAETEAQALRKGRRLYDAEKKRLAKARHYAEGRCRCGRPQDRAHPDGTPMLECSTCAERQKVYNERHQARRRGELPPGRDEAARVETFQQRHRDRRAEIRLETLIAVRQAWMDCPTVAKFGQWLASEIRALTENEAA